MDKQQRSEVVLSVAGRSEGVATVHTKNSMTGSQKKIRELEEQVKALQREKSGCEGTAPVAQ